MSKENRKKIFEEMVSWQESEYLCEYFDAQNFSKIAPITQVQALCMLATGEFVVYKDTNGNYGLPGGTVELGETLDETLFRELKEEASVKPTHYGPLLYLKLTELSQKPEVVTYQVRYWAVVEPLEQAVHDPAGKAIERVIVQEENLINLLGWGKKVEVYLKQLKRRGIR